MRRDMNSTPLRPFWPQDCSVAATEPQLAHHCQAMRHVQCTRDLTASDRDFKISSTVATETHETQVETIGQRLRRLRTERRLSQRELSSPGVSYAYISRIEAGTRQPSVKALRMLARKLGVSAGYLETGSELNAEEERELRLADAELKLRLDEDASEAESVVQDVLQEALAAGDKTSATRARTSLGLAAAQRGDEGRAVALLEEAT